MVVAVLPQLGLSFFMSPIEKTSVQAMLFSQLQGGTAINHWLHPAGMTPGLSVIPPQTPGDNKSAVLTSLSTWTRRSTLTSAGYVGPTLTDQFYTLAVTT
jgi:hypothetical protein